MFRSTLTLRRNALSRAAEWEFLELTKVGTDLYPAREVEVFRNWMKGSGHNEVIMR